MSLNGSLRRLPAAAPQFETDCFGLNVDLVNLANEARSLVVNQLAVVITVVDTAFKLSAL